MSPVRVIVYIDGFNVYHRIAERRKENPSEDYRWLNYRKALGKLLHPPEQLEKIVLFTAIGFDMSSDSIKRHQTLIAALKNAGVEVVYGKFIGKGKKRKEKQTDVNIAVRALTDAAADSYDRCYLVSSDSDFVPLLAAVQAPPYSKQAGLIAPPQAKDGANAHHIDALISSTSQTSGDKRLVRRWRWDDLAGCSFPEHITTPYGRTISKPSSYCIF